MQYSDQGLGQAIPSGMSAMPGPKVCLTEQVSMTDREVKELRERVEKIELALFGSSRPRQ